MKYLLLLLFLLPLTLTSQSYICDSVFLLAKDTFDGSYNRYIDAKAVSAIFMVNEQQNLIVRSIDCNLVIYYNAYPFYQTIDNKPYIYYQSANDSDGQNVLFIDPYKATIKYIDTSNDIYMYIFSVKKIIYKE